MAAIGPLALVAIGISVAGEAAEVISQKNLEESQERQIEQSMRENEIEADQKSLQRADQLQKTVSESESLIGVRGITADSASYKAITEEDFNNYAKDYQLDKLQAEDKQAELQYQMDQAKDAYKFGIAKDIYDFGNSMLSDYNSGAFIGNNAGKTASKSASVPTSQNTV